MHFSVYDLFLSVVWVLSTYVKYALSKLVPDRKQLVPADVVLPPSIDVRDISASIKRCSHGQKLKVDRSSRLLASNSIRSKTKKKKNDWHIVRLGRANRILLIDTGKSEVTVEPGVTMEELVDSLLPHGLVPFVVPEFRGLTVGGVIAGAGIESGSWVHGQFGDHLVAARYVLSDGSVVDCSPQYNADLFYGASGSCGTLGLLVSAKFRVQKIKTDRVKLRYFEVPVEKSIEALSARIQTMRGRDGTPGLIDAIVYEERAVIIVAEYDHLGLPTQSFSRGRDPWFYQYVATTTHTSDVVPLKDYLFRYDAGAFWMSQYAMSPFTDLETIVQSLLPPITDPYTKKVLTLMPFGGYNRLSRWLLSPLLRTSPMYQRLHQAPVQIVADSLVIQDVYIPTANANEFLSWVRVRLGVDKIWLCPMKSTTTSQILSPHFVNSPTIKEPLEGFVNFGIWLHKASWQPGTPYARKATREIERKVALLGGRKMLYSLSSYGREEWHDIYDMKAYEKLKRKWDPLDGFGNIYDKVGHSAF